VVVAMVEGDEKSKHIFSLGGWVQAAQQAEELVIREAQAHHSRKGLCCWTLNIQGETNHLSCH